MDQHVAVATLGEAAEAPRRRRTPAIIGAIAIAVLIASGVLYWLHARHYAGTDDAFIDGHISQISAQVSGRVLRLAAQDNQPVSAGALLLEIDPRPFVIRLDQARARRAQAEAALEQARAMLPLREADAAGALADVRVAEADLTQAKQDLARYTAVNPNAISRQQVDQASSGEKAAEARLEARRQTVAGMRAQLLAERAAVDAAAASLQTADADVADASLQLSYAHLTAPAAGIVTRRTVEVGNWVQPGQALLAIVQPACWVTANFKEGQLADMHAGEPASVSVDARPGEALQAHVDSLQSGTGSVFSSLPAENATGNYVKVVQRVPVKLVFDRDGQGGDPCTRLNLAPGMSVIARVKVR
jgi:membrane fusion protein (multidrug efflux system)